MTQRPQPVVLHAAITALLTSGVALAALLWTDSLTPEMQAAIIAFGTAIIGVSIAWFSTKNQVTPVSDPVLAPGTTVKTTVDETVPNATVVTDGL